MHKHPDFCKSSSAAFAFPSFDPSKDSVIKEQEPSWLLMLRNHLSSHIVVMATLQQTAAGSADLIRFWHKSKTTCPSDSISNVKAVSGILTALDYAMAMKLTM